MFKISAPYPNVETLTLLPSPQLGDTESLTDTVSTKRAMNGTLYTYVKTKGGRRRLQWSFRLTRNKSLELRAFIQSYFASKIHILDHNNRTFVGNLTNNPFEFEAAERAYPNMAPLPRGETVIITLDFEGVEMIPVEPF